LLLGLVTLAQVPEGFKYQAVLRDGSGEIRANSDVEIDISVLQGSEMGTSQILSVPYAMYAEKSGNAFSGKYEDLVNAPDLSDTARNRILRSWNLQLQASAPTTRPSRIKTTGNGASRQAIPSITIRAWWASERISPIMILRCRAPVSPTNS